MDWARILAFVTGMADKELLAGLGAIEFAGNKLAVPGQDGVWPGYIGHLGKSLAAQSMTDLVFLCFNFLTQRGYLKCEYANKSDQPCASTAFTPASTKRR
jgi:hypothetical protein